MMRRLGAFLVASVVDKRAADKMPQDDGARIEAAIAGAK